MEFEKESLTPQNPSGKKLKAKSFASAAFLTPENQTGGRQRAGTTIKSNKWG